MWRSLGAFILLMLMTGAVHADLAGRVESIGFDGAYRPSCWTPMRVVVVPDIDTKTGQYEIRITQRDLDGDRAVYRTPITLTAGQGEQRFWAYFLPESVQGGLPDSSMTDLSRRLSVKLHDAEGRELATCALEAINLTRIDPTRGSRSRGSMFILRTPPTAPFARDSLLAASGPNDDTGLIRLHQNFHVGVINPDRFPDRAIGLEAVDTILWLDGDPRALLGAGGSTQFDALREWVRLGGHLVINTPAQWQVLSNFGDLMPVDIESVEMRSSLEPIYSLANRRSFSRMITREDKSNVQLPNPWTRAGAEHQFARARLRKNATQIIPIVWKEAVDNSSTQPTTGPVESTPAIESPWLASRNYGHGCVTWIGSDVSTLQNVNYGWNIVWPVIFGSLRTGDTLDQLPISTIDTSEGFRSSWLSGVTSAEIARSMMLDGIALKSKTAALVSVSAIFFLAYWALAGPGLFLILRMRKLAHLNWFAFGVAALCGTAVTMLLVRLLVRGPPEMRHVTLVKVDQVSDTPTMIRSRIGMYIPRDGTQHVTVAAGDSASVLPFSSHPNFTGQGRLVPRAITYDVPSAVRDAKPNELARLDLPYRSSLKRMEARWKGQVSSRIDGTLKLVGRDPFVEGTLINRSGIKLKNIYLAFSYTWSSQLKDYVVFVPEWDVDQPLNIQALITPENGDARLLPDKSFSPNLPLAGTLEEWTERVWYTGTLRAGHVTQAGELVDYNAPAPASIPMMSLFRRLHPMKPNGRSELIASGARDFDASIALHSGNLLIIAQADEQPIPLDFRVNGDEVTGSGRVIYQFVLPIKR